MRIGIVGAGQLGQMIGIAARELGQYKILLRHLTTKRARVVELACTPS
jgi:phosphoribosylaminoimidazole carboxylase (NCAIR synthetase)